MFHGEPWVMFFLDVHGVVLPSPLQALRAAAKAVTAG
jgi:hypothetical protein